MFKEGKKDLKGEGFLKEAEGFKKLSASMGLPFKYDLILCNPPWIPASLVSEVNPLDNGVYDPNEEFLKACINFARLHLSSNG